MPYPILQTERLTLRVLQLEDSPSYQHYLLDNQAHLQRWEPERQPDYFSLQACEARIAQFNQQFISGTGFPFSIWLEDRMIGICHFSNVVRGAFQACHLGYAIAADCEGKALMREAVQAGLDYVFLQQGLHRVMANYVPENTRSAALLRSLGFEQEGYAKAYLRINGSWRDHVLTALVAPSSPD